MKMRTQQSKTCRTLGKQFWEGNSKHYRSIAKKQEKAQINNLTSHLKELEKEQQTNPKVSGSKEIIKIRLEINEIESKENNTKSKLIQELGLRKYKHDWQTFNQTHQEKIERTQINKIRNERGEITTNTKEIPRIIRQYYKQ